MPIRERIALPGEKELGKKESFPRNWVAPGAKSSEDVGSSCATNRKNLSFRDTLGADGVKEESAWGRGGSCLGEQKLLHLSILVGVEQGVVVC